MHLFFVPYYAVYFCFVVFAGLLYFSNAITNADFLYVVSFSLAIFALNAYNQIEDYHIDKISKKFRPLVRKDISFFEAKVICVLLYVFSIVFNIIYFNERIFELLIFFIALSFIYSKNFFNLRSNFGSNFFGSIFYGLIPLLLVQILINTDVSLLIIFFTFNTFLIASLKDFEDSSADKRYGLKTLPNVVDTFKAKKIICGLLCLVAIFSASFFFLKTFFFYNALLFLFFSMISIYMIHLAIRDAPKSAVPIGLTYNLFFLVLQLFFY